MVELRTRWEMIGIPLILSVSGPDSEQLTVVPLSDFCWQMVHWPIARQGGDFSLWAKRGTTISQQVTNVFPTIFCYLRNRNTVNIMM